MFAAVLAVREGLDCFERLRVIDHLRPISTDDRVADEALEVVDTPVKLAYLSLIESGFLELSINIAGQDEVVLDVFVSLNNIFENPEPLMRLSFPVQIHPMPVEPPE